MLVLRALDTPGTEGRWSNPIAPTKTTVKVKDSNW